MCGTNLGFTRKHKDVVTDLLEAAVGADLRHASPPAGKTLGMPSNLLFVNGANLCARHTHKICFPNEPVKERNVGTYPCEGYFSSLVVTPRGYKPTGPQAVYVMLRAARVTDIRFMLGLPFYESLSRRQHYVHSINTLSIVPQKMAAWNDGSVLSQTDRSRESRKKRKGIDANKHAVAQVTIRAHHKKRKTN
jgi:hypothetical protein